MGVKTANVTARIQPDIKQSAEAILERLGIPVSVFIDMAYRQVIVNDGIPFPLMVEKKQESVDYLTIDQFKKILEVGMKQVEQGMTQDVNEAFDQIRERI